MPSFTSLCPPCLPLCLSVHHAFPYVPLCITLQFLHHSTLCQVSYVSLLTLQSLRDSAVGLKSLDVLIGELSPEGYSFGEERDPHTGGSGELSRPNAPPPCHRHKSFTSLSTMHYRLCTSLGVVVNQIYLVTATSPLPLCPLCTPGCTLFHCSYGQAILHCFQGGDTAFLAFLLDIFTSQFQTNHHGSPFILASALSSQKV